MAEIANDAYTLSEMLKTDEIDDLSTENVLVLTMCSPFSSKTICDSASFSNIYSRFSISFSRSFDPGRASPTASEARSTRAPFPHIFGDEVVSEYCV